ncbi:unnamed protein product [Linum trigynum]|uniref:Uncharacterized protein n=1 Tax=Linum trigynum TaxID=586398 RepID=A0AAV2DF73_9ROSI
MTKENDLGMGRGIATPPPSSLCSFVDFPAGERLFLRASHLAFGVTSLSMEASLINLLVSPPAIVVSFSGDKSSIRRLGVLAAECREPIDVFFPPSLLTSTSSFAAALVGDGCSSGPPTPAAADASP